MKKALHIIGNVVAWLIVLLAVIMTVVVFSSQSGGGVPNLFGKMLISIQTPSMSGTIETGDLVLVSKVEDAAALKAGDVITYWTVIDGKKALNTHRIVEVRGSASSPSFITKGDANDVNDENLVSSSDVVGIWNDTRLPFLGAALDFLRSSTGFLLCIVAPLAVFFLYELYRFIAVVISMRKPKLTPEMEEELKRQAVEEYLARQNQGGESSTETGQDSAAEDAREDEAALTK